MAIKIESADAIVTVNEHGAELVSFIDKATGKEYMWSGDAKYWGRHAPVLFPIVGRLKDDIYKVDGQEYHLSQHGFARDLNFEILNQSKNHAIFELHSSDETKEVYPFDFILRIGFELTGRSFKLKIHQTKKFGLELADIQLLPFQWMINIIMMIIKFHFHLKQREILFR